MTHPTLADLEAELTRIYAPYTGDSTMTQYTTYGPTRGQCRHAHDTYHDALKCRNADRQVGYTDREAYGIDEDGYLITDHHHKALFNSRPIKALCSPA